MKMHHKDCVSQGTRSGFFCEKTTFLLKPNQSQKTSQTSEALFMKREYKCIKMLSQIPPGANKLSSKNGYFVHLRTVPDRLPSDFTGAGSMLTTVRAPVCRRVCSRFSWRFHQKGSPYFFKTTRSISGGSHI